MLRALTRNLIYLLAVVVVVNSLTLVHDQRTDLWYSFIADFRYQLICKSLMFGHGNGGRIVRGTAYTRVYTVTIEPLQ